MATSTTHRAAEAINRCDGNLSGDDLKRIEQAANSIITTLDGQVGLTDEEALVLLFYCCHSSNPRENLAYFGSTITRKRLHYSTHDCEFIIEAARLIEKGLGHEAIENRDMTRDEEDKTSSWPPSSFDLVWHSRSFPQPLRAFSQRSIESRMPGYVEISLNDMPDTLSALDSEINARLKAEADVSAFLVRNRALLWKLKMKRNLLRQGDS
ncbi:hypothetical protein LCI18_013776 [Fusarium solani-melongenae]|uniref:Uncharacterized protein n=1 Tax=Fusarium solani subsp. cucurbitae TaxID=2747967 RepID=A0ACD3ZP34_FUSSC|nr:hypothetical protein LCI18_013776 [Fusarium solani-melongenae]